MNILAIEDREKIIEESVKYGEFRNKCKNYLMKKGMCFDKFTMVSHDSEIGFISEKIITNYIRQKLKTTDLKVEQWDNQFNLKDIETKILNDDNPEYVRNYFYDAYDIRIYNDNIDIRIDVKSAFTNKEPRENWNFMYPVIQAHKPGKDHMILAYCVIESKFINSLKKIVVPGYTTEDIIKKCRIIKKGEFTRFGTVSQLDNYETELARDYLELDKLINKILDLVKK